MLLACKQSHLYPHLEGLSALFLAAFAVLPLSMPAVFGFSENLVLLHIVNILLVSRQRKKRV